MRLKLFKMVKLKFKFLKSAFQVHGDMKLCISQVLWCVMSSCLFLAAEANLTRLLPVDQRQSTAVGRSALLFYFSFASVMLPINNPTDALCCLTNAAFVLLVTGAPAPTAARFLM